jgi:tetratricopeptide (TPR) repeat protein
LCQAGIQAGIGSEAVQFAHHLMAWAYNRRGEEHDRLGEATKALVDFNAAVKHDPNRWQAVHNRGVSLAQSGRMVEALADFSRTIQLQPRHAKAYSNRAAIQEQQGLPREALKNFQKAVELDDTLAAAHAGMGRTLLQLGRSQEALLALDQALTLDAENPAYRTSRGDVFAGLGEYEAALADYGKAIDVDPSYATAYRNGSWLLATCPDQHYRDAENAILGAQKALDLTIDERHLCLDTLAAARANAGEFDKAVEAVARAIEEAPEGLRPLYATRLKMYQERRAFRTQPVQQAGFVEVVEE